MKMTVDIFDERVKKDKEQLANLEAEISALMAQEAELDADMTAAANCGDEALFKAKKAEKEGVSDSIFVKRSFKDRLTSSVTAEDARAAWADFVKTYDKRMTAALADFAAEKEKFLKMYSDLVDAQKGACAVRERLGSAVGLPVSSFAMVTIPVQTGANVKGALKLGGVNEVDPDVCYFLSNYIQKTGACLVSFDGTTPIDPELARLRTVVVNRKSKEPFISYS